MPYQIRIDEKIDIYPTNKKYCILAIDQWGTYLELRDILDEKNLRWSRSLVDPLIDLSDRDALLDRIYKKIKNNFLNLTDEMSGKLKNLVYTRFTSYKEAMISWGVSEQEYREHFTENNIKAYEARRLQQFFPKYNKEDVIQKYADFFFEKKRMPTWGEVKQFGLPGRVPFMRAFGRNKSEVENSFKVKSSQY